MRKDIKEEISDQIIRKAKEFGASSAGIASVEALKESPSHLIYGRMGEYRAVGSGEGPTGLGKVAWPGNAKCAIVIAVLHPQANPELDWWKTGYFGGTRGNRMLLSTNSQLSHWLEEKKRVRTIELSYHIEHGGIFLKDAAVMAGLGCIGKNNLLVTPEFGPRVRLRAMVTDEVLPCTGPIEFDPCEECSAPCMAACPKEAFRKKIYSEDDFGLDQLPGRTGVFSKQLCHEQMRVDEDRPENVEVDGELEPGKWISYCRRCELACPVGR
ncbi:MAG: epoxyqueuosine reductase [Proteobacteria bacterium]|nr:epoxyqueuosine reductase [Pseudomonadota bacterium]NIS68083.1 epoxyqueuosine reductase [Pseudomonadota bacterium]